MSAEPPPEPRHAAVDPGWKTALEQVLVKLGVVVLTAVVAWVATEVNNLTSKVNRVGDQVTSIPPDLGQSVNQLGTALGNQLDTIAKTKPVAPVVNVTAPKGSSTPTQVSVVNQQPPAAKPAPATKPVVAPSPTPSPTSPACPLGVALLCPKR